MKVESGWERGEKRAFCWKSAEKKEEKSGLIHGRRGKGWQIETWEGLGKRAEKKGKRREGAEKQRREGREWVASDGRLGRGGG
jgi:hypothetical protein